MAEMAVARTQQAAQRKAMMAREAVMQQQEYEEAVRHAMVEMERESKEASVSQDRRRWVLWACR